MSYSMEDARNYELDLAINNKNKFWLRSQAESVNHFIGSAELRRSEKCVSRDIKKLARNIKALIESEGLFSEEERKTGKPNTTTFKSGLHNAYLCAYDNDGDCEATSVLIPSITDVKSIDDKVVIVNFADGTVEKAVLSDDDKFSLEQGISICITKKILSDSTNGHGSSAYNKLIDYGMKVYNNKKKNIKAIEESEKKTKEAERKKAEKLRKKKAKRKAAEREEQISIQAEAIRRAMATISTPKTAE